MNARDIILNNIKLSTKGRNLVPEDVDYSYNGIDLLAKFQEMLKAVSAQYKTFSTFDQANDIVKSTLSGHNRCINVVEGINIKSIGFSQMSKDLHPLDLAIIEGEFGVAENGAIWVNVGLLPDRTIPFICENLIIVLDADKMVSDMHEAYERTQNDDYSYGVFITGPSKTADIEQTLVVGAQGPRKMMVLIRK